MLKKMASLVISLEQLLFRVYIIVVQVLQYSYIIVAYVCKYPFLYFIEAYIKGKKKLITIVYIWQQYIIFFVNFCVVISILFILFILYCMNYLILAIIMILTVSLLLYLKRLFFCEALRLYDSSIRYKWSPFLRAIPYIRLKTAVLVVIALYQMTFKEIVGFFCQFFLQFNVKYKFFILNSRIIGD